MHQVDMEVESNKKTAMLLFFLVRYGQDKYEEMAQADRKLSQRKMGAVCPLTSPT